jgi:hypothetical protein
MHVRKVSLLHALEVLAANTGANWSVAYFAAPNKGAIESALGTLASGQEVEGWKRWSLPTMRGGEEDAGISDPRAEKWQVQSASQPTLHGYLEQASHVLSAQFWAPEQWNPTIAGAPGSGKIKNVLPKLAKAAKGESAEVFLLRGRSQPRRDIANVAPGQEGERGGRSGNRSFGGGPNGPGSDEMRKVMEERERARIERLPKAKQAEALAQLEERRKFFEEMAQLSPEERRAKIEERIEQAMNNSESAARMSAEGTKRGAMKSADQRAEGYRGYLDRKRQR